MNLQKLFSSLALVFITLQMSGQQKFSAGGKVGLGLSSLPELNEASSIFHFAFGATAHYEFIPQILLGADLLFLTSGGDYAGTASIEDPADGSFTDEEYEGRINFTTISIPIYPQFSLGTEDFRYFVNGGIATNLNIFAYETRDYEDGNIKDQVKGIIEDYDKLSFSTIIGAGVKIKLSEGEYVQLDLRATLGMKDIYSTVNNYDPTSVSRNLYTLGATYFF